MKNTRNRNFLPLVLMLTVGLLTVSSAHEAIGLVQANAGTVSSASIESLAFSSNTSAIGRPGRSRPGRSSSSGELSGKHKQTALLNIFVAFDR